LIVHANNKGAGQVRELVNKLDQKMPAQIGGGKIHVLYLRFSDAEKIAQTLNGLSQTSSAPPRTRGNRPGLGVNPAEASLFEGNIKVSADKETNSLVITA